ncbi:hypothetical protein JCM8547_002517, partial [Rhodosporidiobolus lusitaniae]
PFPLAGTASSESPLDSLLSLESSFYERGYQGGLPHGELHGLIKGREIGREKAWELWEEIGYAEGVGRFWREVLEANGKREGRAAQNLDQLQTLVDAFPSSNDSSSLVQPADPSFSLSDPSSTPLAPDEQANSAGDIDIPSLLSSVRSKYRTACASLGVRPRMAVAGAGSKQT